MLVCGITMGAFRLSFVTGSSRILNLDISKFKVIILIHFLICRIKPVDQIIFQFTYFRIYLRHTEL